MSHMKFSFSRGLVNAIVTLIFFIVLPNLIFTALEGYVQGLSLGTPRALGVTATGAFIVAVAFCRGAFPKHSSVWALAGIGSSLFWAVYLYILLGTPASYSTTILGQSVSLIFDISSFALLMAAVIALNSLNNLVELSNARRRKTETERVAETKIAA
nr:hypothetical protein [Candidatus Njordarchaeota archaeon]